MPLFAGLGILGTALLVLVSTGDWLLASILAILGRVGFNGSITFYDALLPHVAKEEDRDRVSARGYALGYLGGGILLAINVVMIQFLPGNVGAASLVSQRGHLVGHLFHSPLPPRSRAALGDGQTGPRRECPHRELQAAGADAQGHPPLP